MAALVMAVLCRFAFPDAAPLVMFFVALVAICVRSSSDRAVKSICYFGLGMISYWLASSSFSLAPGQEWRVVSFIPFLILAMANSLTALVAFADGLMAGGIFAGGSALSLLLSSGPLDFLSIDRFLIALGLFALQSFLFAHFVFSAQNTRKLLRGAFLAAVCSSIIIALVLSLRYVDISTLTNVDALLVSKAFFVFANALWVGFVSNLFFSVVVLLAFNLGLYALEYTRELSEEGVEYFSVSRNEGVVEEKTGKDPYASLVSSLSDFIGKAPKLDSFKATELLNRYKSEYNVLSSKYDTPLKAKANSLLQDATRVVKSVKR